MNSDNRTMIGVVGGMGPYAGLDLLKKIFDLTDATCDQDHLPVTMLSVSHSISDRTDFLLGKSEDNPALAIADVICSLFKQGATVIGMPCNTAHAEPIFNDILNRIPNKVQLVHMINEAADFINENYPTVKNVGILSTTGTFISNVYPKCLSQYGLNGIQVSEEIQENNINPAIYSSNYGVKAHSNPVTQEAIKGLHKGLKYLIDKDAEAIILGCTEIPLAITDDEINGIPLIDATKILARALIMAFSPEDLK
ncbi:MAG TPA: aspartate/glutamate racemase family protein [Candidatus Marinimicrobia bacterium]|jgi:aspartate racemase|nr:aspartate/glutamate racemase family protein [Candidatus Neomarinimicrobiota bacterium]